jgi:hypothetical protein
MGEHRERHERPLAGEGSRPRDPLFAKPRIQSRPQRAEDARPPSPD